MYIMYLTTPSIMYYITTLCFCQVKMYKITTLTSLYCDKL